MHYSDSSTAVCLRKKAPKIVDTIRINGKYFDASMVREKALLALTSSAVVSAIMAIAALIIIL